jgi:predicted MFS family arabinose efflux permease
VLVDATGWRVTLRILAATTAVVLAVGAVFVRERVVVHEDRSVRPSIAVRRPEVVRFLVATGSIGVAVGVILVYQVPLMVGAGLPLATAATIAGARGACQILGRIPIMRLVGRWGPRRVIRLAFAAIGVGVAMLSVAGTVWVAAAFAVVAGFGIGATSPLQGIYADALFDRRRLGAAMGTVSMVFGLAAAAGPAIAGILADVTGSRQWGVVLGTVAAVSAVVLLRAPGEHARP